MKILLTMPFLVALVLAAGPGPLGAQALSFDVAAGVALPIGGAAERRQAGPTARLGVATAVSRRWSLRLDGDWAVLRRRRTSFDIVDGSSPRDLRAVGVSLSGVARPSDAASAPYLLAGVGAHRLQEAGGSPSPYGTTAALLAGLGFEGGRGSVLSPFVEGRAMVHVTDYGSDEWSPTVLLPVVVGVRMRVR